MRAVPFCTSSDPRLTTTQPLLEAVSNQELLGRAIIEVWSVDSRATVIGLADAPTTIQKCAVAALVAQPIRLNTRIPWHSYPATQDIAGQSFLGCVVVEVWSSQSVIGSTLTSVDVLSRAVQKLARSHY